MAKIIIIDDEREFVEMLGLRLRRSGGYEVIPAFDGEEGLKAAQEQKPDLIMLDVMMPKMDGYEMLKRLKENEATKKIPVIVLTASTASSTTDKFIALGVNDFVIKPFEAPALMAKIKKVLEAK